MFKRRKYKLKFKKAYEYVDCGVYKVVSDASLMSVLLALQQKYDFDIVSTKFKDCFGNSCIKIKCNKEDKCNIFSEYCLKLNGQIQNISF